ncbi:MAG: DNA gyrase inhibitor YacG [Pseudomonadota bacterium]
MPDADPPRPAHPPCPICAAPRDEAYRPFCSRRCADVDLGRWLTGRYAVPGEPADPERD